MSVRRSQRSPAPPAGGPLTPLRLQISNDSQLHSVGKGLEEGDGVGVIDVHKVVSVRLQQREFCSFYVYKATLQSECVCLSTNTWIILSPG